MKIALNALILTATLCVGFNITGLASEDHAHKATPNGGRLLDKTEPHAELVIEKDRSVTINFYDDDMKPIAVTSQTVTVIANATPKVTLEFEKQGDSLVSKAKLPEGEGYTLVVQFRKEANAKPVNLRFKLDLHTCGGCQRAEYACTCGY